MKLNIGENIRRLRREANLTQEELGRELDVSPQAISRWENGSAYPDIEFLPTLAKYFDKTVDELMGYGADGGKAHVLSLSRAFANEGRRATPDVERIIAIIREMRRDYLFHFDGGFWWAARNFYRLPGVLPELRKTAEAILAKSTDKLLREAAIYHMSVYEDDEHIGEFMEAHAAMFDLMYQSLYRRRHRLRGEKEQAEVFRQLHFREMIEELLRNAFLRGDRELSAGEHLRVNTFQLELLNWLCGVEPTAEHIIFCDGVLGEWSALRVCLGIQRVGYLASSGDTEGAFAALEDTLSLLRKIVKHVEEVGAEAKVRCGWLDKAQYRLSLPDFYQDGCRQLGEGWEIGPCAIGSPTCDVYGMLTADEETLKWLDPIRDDPRYQSYVERVKAILWKHDYFQALNRYAMEQTDALTQGSSLVCMLSAGKNLYHFLFPIAAEYGQIFSALRKRIPENDRMMAAILCYLPPRELEIPSFAFRKALIQLDDANRNAVIYVQGAESIIRKTLSETLPPS